MRIILSTDLHLSNSEKLGRINENGMNSRLVDKLECFEKSIDHAIVNDADMYIFLGDAFEKLNPPENLRYEFISRIGKLMKNQIPFVKIIGNHVTDGEMFNLKSDKMLAQGLKMDQQHPDLFQIIDTPTTREYDTFKGFFLPYMAVEDLQKAIQKFNTQIHQSKPNLLFGHFGVLGAKMLRYESSLAKKGIAIESLYKFDKVFLGHFHLFQEIKNIIYVGSLAKRDFGDLEFGDDYHGFIDLEINGKDLTWELLSSDDRPFQQFNITEDILDPDTAIMKAKIAEDAILKIVLTGSREWILETNQKKLQDLAAQKGAFKTFIETNIVHREQLEDPTISLQTPFEEDVVHVAEGNKELEKIMTSILKDVLTKTEF